MSLSFEGQTANRELYTKEQRERRDSTRWTLVQGILAPVQFFVFLISLILVVRYLTTGEGYTVATISIILKTLVLYAIMITGAIWEKVVFDQYLLAPSFFWEDVVSFFVIALHTIYLVFLYNGLLSNQMLMYLALSTYLFYIANAIQFLLKLRMARQQQILEFSHA